jgi:hypothetical protein
MRIIFALFLLSISMALGGCFHHTQEVYMVPQVPAVTPLK